MLLFDVICGYCCPFLPLKPEQLLFDGLRMGIHPVPWNSCHFESVGPVRQKSNQITMKGRINWDLYLSLYRISGHLPDSVYRILALVLCWAARRHRRVHQLAPRLRWILVYGVAGDPPAVDGWLPVLLGEGDKERRRGELARKSLTEGNDIARWGYFWFC